MRSGLAIEILIWSKLWVPVGWPKAVISSWFMSCSRIRYLVGCRSIASLVEFDVEAERAELLHQHVEGFRNARLEVVVAAHDGLVDLRAAGDVVRLDGEDFLQGVGRAVGLERPHLHLAEALAAELRLAA